MLYSFKMLIPVWAKATITEKVHDLIFLNYAEK